MRATKARLANETARSISKEVLANLPIQRYEGEIRMVALRKTWSTR